MSLTPSERLVKFSNRQFKKPFLRMMLYKIQNPAVTSDHLWNSKTVQSSTKWIRSEMRFWRGLSHLSHFDRVQRTISPKSSQNSTFKLLRKPPIWQYKIKTISATWGILTESLRNPKLSAMLCSHFKKNKKKRFWIASTNSSSNAIRSWSNCAWTRIWAKTSTNSTSSVTTRWTKVAMQLRSLC